MKKMIMLFLLCATSAFAFPYQTNLLTHSGAISNSFPQFSWTWPRESDQAIVANLGAGATQAAIRVGRNGVWYTTVAGGSYSSAGQWVTVIPRTNIPPPASYDAEILIAESTNSPSGATRVWAYGKVTVMSSLWSSTNRAGWTSQYVSVTLPEGFTSGFITGAYIAGSSGTGALSVAGNNMAITFPSPAEATNGLNNVLASNGVSGSLASGVLRLDGSALQQLGSNALSTAQQAQVLGTNTFSGLLVIGQQTTNNANGLLLVGAVATQGQVNASNAYTLATTASNLAAAAYPASNPSGYQTAAQVAISLGSWGSNATVSAFPGIDFGATQAISTVGASTVTSSYSATDRRLSWSNSAAAGGGSGTFTQAVFGSMAYTTHFSLQVDSGSPLAPSFVPGAGNTNVMTFPTPAQASIPYGLRARMLAASADIYGSTNDALVVGKAGTSANWTELQFSDTIEQAARWTIPANSLREWNGGAVTNRITWYSALTSTNAVVWSVALRTIGSAAVMDAAYATARLCTGAPSATANGIAYCDLVFTPATNEIVVGNASLYELRRKPTDAGDVSATNANVISASMFQ